MKILIIIESIIKGLTKDEDMRQELWLYYLEGNDPSKIDKYYQKLLADKEEWHLRKISRKKNA